MKLFKHPDEVSYVMTDLGAALVILTGIFMFCMAFILSSYLGN
jgi:hypothetical protein